MICIGNAGILPAREPGSSAALSLTTSGQMVALGRSVDMGYCQAYKKNTMNKCNEVIDLSKGASCSYHVKAAYKQVLSKRFGLERKVPGGNMLLGGPAGGVNNINNNINSNGNGRPAPGTYDVRGMRLAADGRPVAAPAPTRPVSQKALATVFAQTSRGALLVQGVLPAPAPTSTSRSNSANTRNAPTSTSTSTSTHTRPATAPSSGASRGGAAGNPRDRDKDRDKDKDKDKDRDRAAGFLDAMPSDVRKVRFGVHVQ